MELLLTTTIVVQAKPSNVTENAPSKFTPLMVTGVPPRMVPEDGEIDVMTGPGDSLSVMTSVADEGEPSVKLPVGLESVSETFSEPSTVRSSIGKTEKVFGPSSLTSQESTPLAAVKSTPATADGAPPVVAL